MSTINVFSNLGENIDRATNAFVSSTASSLIGIITPWALAGVTLYIIIYGYMVMTGRVQEYFYDFAVKSVKIILIAAFALNAGNYLGKVIPAIEGIQQGMLQAGSAQGNNVYEALDGQVEKGLEHLNKINQKSTEIGLWDMVAGNTGAALGYIMLMGLIILTYGLILVSIAATIIISSLFLKILFAIGPFFIMCLMFPPAARYFDNWIGAVMSNAFVFVIASALSVISLEIFISYSKGFNLDSATDSPWSAILQILIVSVILFLATRMTTSIAASLGGGVASEAMSAGQALAGASAGVASARAGVASARRGAKSAYDMGRGFRNEVKGNHKKSGNENGGGPPSKSYTTGRLAGMAYNRFAKRSNEVAAA